MFASCRAAVTAFDQLLFDAATHNRIFEHTVTLVTHLGRMPVLGTLAVAAASIMSWRGRGVTPVCLIGLACGAASGTSHAIKNIVQRPRPDLVFAVPPYETTWSFPSGHSMNAVLVAGVLALLVRKPWAYCLAGAFALVIGATRVYLGHHWPTDVLAGWALGIAYLPLFGWLIAKNFPILPRRKTRN